MDSTVLERLRRLERSLQTAVDSVDVLSHEASGLRQGHDEMQERLARVDSMVGPLAETATASASALAALESQVSRLNDEIGRLSRFVLTVADLRQRQQPAAGPVPRLQSPRSLDDQFADLERAMPRTFRLWKQLLEFNRESYAGFPVHSCSVEGHPSATLFRSFVDQFRRGYVLDIGCGPQPVPLYLEHHPIPLIHGIDPISSPDRHPFAFYQGVAEFLPWSDGSFDQVVAATSLDHVLFLDRALREISRVLKDDGEFLVWVAFVAGSAPYDPWSPDIEPVDQYHLFHFTEAFFESSVAPFFRVKDKLRVNLEIDHHFYRLVRLPPPPVPDSPAAVRPHQGDGSPAE